MCEQDTNLFDESMFAGLDANTAFKEAYRHLKAMAGTDESSFSESIIKIGWMIVFQSSVNMRRLTDKLDEVVESLDCARAKVPDFWMTSDLAAIDKAKEIGLKIQHEWTAADLRYKLHQAVYGGEHG